eukprot:SAG22_NODE_66_length_22936_cov_626.714279_20_plen_1767_part_00
MLLDDSEPGIQTWLNTYLTSGDARFNGMCSVFGPIGFRKNSEISAGHPNVFADGVQQSDASENALPGLVLFYICGTSFIITLAFLVNHRIPNRTLAVHSGFRKVLRNCQKPWPVRFAWRQRSKQLLGIVCLFLVVVPPVAEASAAAAVGMTDTSQPNQLALTDFSDPQQLQTLFGAMMTELNEVRHELHAVKNENIALQNRTQVVETMLEKVTKDEAVLENKTQVLKTENKAARAELQQVKKDRDAFEHKTRVVEVELRRKIMQLRTQVIELRNQTKTTSARLDQCEADTHPFIKEMERRHLQDEETLCRGSGLTAMFAACCPSSQGNGGHRRFLQSQGCDVLPDTCPSACAPLFIEFYDGCQDMVNDLTPAEQQEFAGLYADCNEVEQQSAMANMHPVDVKMFRITIDQEAEQQAAMANGGSAGPSPPFGPVVLPPSGSPPASLPEDGAATDVQEYHAQCTTANIMTCVPACNATHHGFELLATIDGTDTKFSCNLANQQYSWVGAAALGGFLGQNVDAFVSAVISGAAGTYVLTLTEDADVGTDLVVQPGQNVNISGDAGLAEAPSWGMGGFTVENDGLLSLTGIVVDGAIMVHNGGSLSVTGGRLAAERDIIVHDRGSMSIQGGRLGENTIRIIPNGTLKLNQVIWKEQSLTLIATQNLQCYQPYTTLNDSWRSSGNTLSSNHGDCSDGTGVYDTGVGGSRWYRFVGAGGDALALSHPGVQHCGTYRAGWLSGWSPTANSDPPESYNQPGRYPEAAQGVTDMIACFGYSNDPCDAGHVVVGVVQCQGFLLWRLPDAPHCVPDHDAYVDAYCTASSGIGSESGRRLQGVNQTQDEARRVQTDDEQTQDIRSVLKRLDQLEQDKTILRVDMLRQIDELKSRIETCETATSKGKEAGIVRRMQGEDTLCRGSGLTAMFAACCPAGSGGGHRRFLQHAQGCDVLPETCPTACAPLFVEFYEGCQGMIGDLTADERQQFAGLYADCNEMAQQLAAVADGAKPALMFHMVVIDQEAEQQAAMANSGSGPSPPFGPVVLPPASPPASGGAGSGTPGAVQEFQRVCSRANLTVCAPQCNPVTEGYLLSVLIEGRGTLMTCNQEDDVYSWQGQSALGSCITKRGPTWLENIMTHAAGTFALELVASVAVVIVADLVAGQSALLHGIAEGQSPVWTFLGEGPAFIVGAGAELEISAVIVAATSGLAFRIAGSSTVVLNTLELQKGDGSTDAISCAALATGVGQAGLTCEDTGFGGVNVAGPLFISTSGAGFGMGATKYMGDNRSVFEEAVSTREPGLYTCQISHDENVTLTLPVESAMHVSIVGDVSMPQWSFTGEGLAFTVAVHAYLNLAYVTVPGGQISLMRGGEFSLDHVQMQGTQIHVAGSLAASNSQLTDVQFETEAPAVMTIDSTTISGTGEEALALPIGCSATINGGEIRNVELQVSSDGELILAGTAIYVEGMAVSVATGGSFTVSSSQLIHGETTDPFPCNGANMACTGQHAGSVIVAGPASINTAAPLVCADESASSCLSGYVDMPSCLADIARGMESCFVYLQRDTGDLGTISIDDGEHFEIHGNQRESKLRILADFGVSGVLVLADLAVIGGSSDGSQISVEAGGQLRFDRVQMAGGSVTFAGVVSLVESSLAEVAVTASSGSVLRVVGGVVTGSTVAMTSGGIVVEGACVLTDSPIDVGGAGSSVTISGGELQSAGSSVPLTIEADGVATVTETVFRSTAGDITAVSVAEGGSLTVGESQLVGADGSADPFPAAGLRWGA